jgi:hypothetical protein
MAYVGQTGRNFLAWYNENKLAFRNNSDTSKFAQHLLEHTHSFNTIENAMQILQYQRKSAHLNTVERYYIHVEFVTNHLNDTQNIFPNPIFEDPPAINPPPTPALGKNPRTTNMQTHSILQQDTTLEQQ